MPLADSTAVPPPTPGAPADTFPLGQPIAWRPDAQSIAESNLARFMQRHGVLSYKGLVETAKADVAWFWDAAIRDLDVQFYTPYTSVLERTDGTRARAPSATGFIATALPRRRKPSAVKSAFASPSLRRAAMASGP